MDFKGNAELGRKDLTTSDATRNFRVSHKFDFINGYRVSKNSDIGIGDMILDVNRVRYFDRGLDEQSVDWCYPQRPKSSSKPQLPHYVTHDRLCLKFHAYFKERPTTYTFQSRDTLRHVTIIYYLEDDTMTIHEPPIANSGLMQGRLVRRGRIPRDDKPGEYWSWKDLNVGMELTVNSITYRTINCDAFTKKFLVEHGVRVNEPEVIETADDPSRSHDNLKMRKRTDDVVLTFVALDHKVGDSDQDLIIENGRQRFVVNYYLTDGTISIKEIQAPGDNPEPNPFLLRRTKVPKVGKLTGKSPPNYSCSFWYSSNNGTTETIQPEDLQINRLVSILGRDFLLVDSDAFTREYYKRTLGIELEPAKKSIVKMLERKVDRERNVARTIKNDGRRINLNSVSPTRYFAMLPKQLKGSVMNQLENAGKYFRYKAKLESGNDMDACRQFIIVYSLADGTVRIHESQIPNAGIIGGKFLQNQPLIKPGSDVDDPEFYGPNDFYIGASVTANNHTFRIVGVDLFVHTYIMEHRNRFTQQVIDSINEYVHREGLLPKKTQDSVQAVAVNLNSTDDNSAKDGEIQDEQVNLLEERINRTQDEIDECLAKFNATMEKSQ